VHILGTATMQNQLCGFECFDQDKKFKMYHPFLICMGNKTDHEISEQKLILRLHCTVLNFYYTYVDTSNRLKLFSQGILFCKYFVYTHVIFKLLHIRLCMYLQWADACNNFSAFFDIY